MSNQERLPNFLYIGAAKCASTWIFRSLQAHPQVFVPPAKDIFYFDREYHRGLDWYRSLFAAARPEHQALGELSHFYLYSDEVARRIFETLPGVKLMACVRNPIRRAWSAYQFKKRNGLTRGDATLESVLAEDPQKLTRGLYAEHVARYRQIFGPEQFQVFVYDDLEADAVEFGRSIYEFLNVDPTFDNSFAGRKVLPASRPRLSIAAAFTRHAARIVRRKLGFPNVVGRLKSSKWLTDILYVPLAEKDREQLSSEEWARLAAYYADDVDTLSQLLGRDLRHWLVRTEDSENTPSSLLQRLEEPDVDG